MLFFTVWLFFALTDMIEGVCATSRLATVHAATQTYSSNTQSLGRQLLGLGKKRLCPPAVNLRLKQRRFLSHHAVPFWV